jgi:hypothetical protein
VNGKRKETVVVVVVVAEVFHKNKKLTYLCRRLTEPFLMQVTWACL